MDNLQKMEELRALMAEKQKEIEELGKQAFKDIVKVFFQSNPEVQAVVWNQYTPYFNDGDTCEFMVCDPVFVTKGFDKNDLLSSSWEYETGEKENSPVIGITAYHKNSYKDSYRSLSKFIAENQDVMEKCFGDHASVYVTPDEIIIEEYEHD